MLTVFKKYGITPEIVSAHGRGSLARDYTQADGCAVVFTIDMPEKDGFSVAEELSAMPSKPLSFSCPAWKIWCITVCVSAVLVSPQTHLEELPQVTEKMLRSLNSRQIHYTVTMNGSSTRIPITEIAYFESQGHYVIAVHYNEKSLRFKARTADIETALSKYFMPCAATLAIC